MEEQERLRRLGELKKQRDELDKLIQELTESSPVKTNIPYTSVYLDAHPQHSTRIDFNAIDARELLQMRIFVNKKCNQISTDFDHTLNLINEIIPYKSNSAFREIFTRKLLDQGRIQVSGHLESYKPFSFLLLKLDSTEIVSMYVKLMILKEGSESELRGMYAIYFGYLNLKEDVDECWMWLASVLNTSPNKFTGYVLEVFLVICGDLLRERISGKFSKLIKYINTHFLKELNNSPVETRISTVLSCLKS